jgi:hypothetical protein
MNRTLEGRVSRLEDATGVKDEPPRYFAQIIVQPEEADDDVIARWRAEHPEAPENVFFIVRKIVCPLHREVTP